MAKDIIVNTLLVKPALKYKTITVPIIKVFKHTHTHTISPSGTVTIKEHPTALVL